jgi:hypothetical protein
MLEQGFKAAAITLSLGLSRLTISRDLARNNYTATAMPHPYGRPFLAGGYRCVRANQLAHVLCCNLRMPRAYGRWYCIVGLPSLRPISRAIPEASQWFTIHKRNRI